MRDERESVTFFEEDYDGVSRYSKDGKFAYSIPDSCFTYILKSGCTDLELKGCLSIVSELTLPASFESFDVESIHCLPCLRKITAYSEFHFVSGWGKYASTELNVTKFWRGTSLKEICVLPWLVDKYKKMFGYWKGYREAIIKVTALPDDVASRFIAPKKNGLITSKDGKTIVKVDNNIKVLEIPIEIERIAATAFDKDNTIEKLVILGDSEDFNKDRRRKSWVFEFHKDAVNSLINVKTLVFQGPMHTSFYDDILTGAKMPNLKTIVYPLWNYNHFCFRGSEAESASIHEFEVKAENFSSIELIEEDGIIYTKDGRIIVSGVDCKSKTIRIKNGVEEIFEYAFCCNLAIEEVYIPSSVTKVGNCAFKSCKNIKKIIFNFNYVTKDAEHAFFTYSPNITFYLPLNTEFANIIRHQYEKLHKEFRSQGFGELTEKYVKDNSLNVSIYTLPYYPGEVSIDEGTNMVYDEKGEIIVGVLYEYAKDIVTITLPNHIKDIYESAFCELSLVEKIVVPNNFDIIQIYEMAQTCPKLKTIVVGDEQFVIEDGVIYSHDFKEIVKVSSSVNFSNFVCKEGVELIAPSAFEGHKELSTIKLPQTIKGISERAFANTGITEIAFPTSLQKLGKEVFTSCNLSAILYEGQIASGANAYDGVKFIPSAYIKVHKKYKDEFIRVYPKLKSMVKTPLPIWLRWLE